MNNPFPHGGHSSQQLSPPLSPTRCRRQHLRQPQRRRTLSRSKERPSSRAGSPTRSHQSQVLHDVAHLHNQLQTSLPSKQTTSSSSKAPLSLAPPPVLLAADEDGNISVVTDIPVSPRSAPTGLEARSTEQPAPASAPADAQNAGQNGRSAKSLSDEIEAANAVTAPKMLIPRRVTMQTRLCLSLRPTASLHHPPPHPVYLTKPTKSTHLVAANHPSRRTTQSNLAHA